MTERVVYYRLSDLKGMDGNYRIHDVAFLAKQIREMGFIQYPVVSKDGIVVVGNGRTLKALKKIKSEGPASNDKTFPPKNIETDQDGEWIVPCIPADHLSPSELNQLAVTENVAHEKGSVNKDALKVFIEQGRVSKDRTGLTKRQLDRIMKPPAEKPPPRQRLTPLSDVPNALFLSERQYGMPILRLDRQADVLEQPIVKWGSVPRTSAHAGTVHFYTDDYKFLALTKNPMKLLDSRVVIAVEPNLSTFEHMPRYEALHRIGTKRYMARLWQEHGVLILVDLNVAERFRMDNLFGVPQGWRAYATRALAKQEGMIKEEYALAAQHRGSDDVLFVVFGGNTRIAHLCEERGWIWIAEHQDRVRGRH